MTTGSRDPGLRLSFPDPVDFGDSPVVMRSWLLAPDGDDRSGDTPLLTGLYGYPWRSAELEARCTAGSPAAGQFSLPPRREPHHPVVPEPSCTCGIYAGRDELVTPRVPTTPRGVPVARGFIQLTGRILAGATTLRASRAEIVGPLTISAGRPPWSPRRGVRRPVAVSVEPDRFRVHWSGRRATAPYEAWLARISNALADRYSVAVVSITGRPQ